MGYCITNLINEKKYVGKTTYSITKRFQEHCKDSKKVEQYSLEGVFIKEWESITLAAHWLVDNGYAKTYNSGVKQKIRLCMRGENKTAYKFIWKNPCERTI